MSRKRVSLLTALAILTVFFLGIAAYTFYGNPFNDDPISGKTLPLGEAPQAIRLTVYETGMAAVTAQQLREYNLPFQDFSANSLSLTRDGEQIPFYLSGEGNDATLYFFAQAITRSVEAPAVYWLSPGTGTTMRQRNAAPTGPGTAIGQRYQQWEKNSTFQALATGDDNWLGQNLFAPGSLDLPLDNIRPSGGPGELKIRVWSSNKAPAKPDHHLEILLNENKLASFFWDGIKQETITVTLPADTLRVDSNILALNAPGDTGAAGESIYLDWVRLEYEGELDASRGQLLFRSDAGNILINGTTDESLVFDISDQQAPIALNNTQFEENSLNFAGAEGNHHYLVLNHSQAMRPQISPVPEWQTPLKDTAQGADYIAIVPNVDKFTETLQPLLDYRAEQGLRVQSVYLDQVYDEFAYGRETPQAIRDFLAYAVAEWEPPSPRFVLLVGDATYDVNDYTNGRNKNLLPTYLVFTEFAGYVASDTWFTMLDEGTLSPNLSIGRFPAQNARQLQTMVEKTIAYEETAPTEWLNRALLVADDELRFNDASDWLDGELGAIGYQTQKLYMTENEDIHDAIISALNHGVGIVNYVGHGGIEVWGDELVLEAEDASMLSNGMRLPIFTTFTCLNGFFNHPQVDALSETLLWAERGGIVAAVAPSGRTFTSQQTPLANVFYTHLLDGEAATLGEALLQAKILGAENPDLDEVIHTFNLLGDPALRFQVPQATTQSQ